MNASLQQIDLEIARMRKQSPSWRKLWGAILPLRWYMAVLLGKPRGPPLYDSPRPFAMLAGLAILYMLLAFLGLRARARSIARAAAEAEPVTAAALVRRWRDFKLPRPHLNANGNRSVGYVVG